MIGDSDFWALTTATSRASTVWLKSWRVSRLDLCDHRHWLGFLQTGLWLVATQPARTTNSILPRLLSRQRYVLHQRSSVFCIPKWRSTLVSVKEWLGNTASGQGTVTFTTLLWKAAMVVGEKGLYLYEVATFLLPRSAEIQRRRSLLSSLPMPVFITRLCNHWNQETSWPFRPLTCHFYISASNVFLQYQSYIHHCIKLNGPAIDISIR